MHEDLVIAGVIVVHHEVDFWNVKAASSKISDYQNGRFSLSEVVQRIGTLFHVHLTIHSEAGVELSNEGEQIVDVEPGGDEDDNFLPLYDVGQEVQQKSCFLLGTHHHEVDLHRLRQCNFLMDVAVVPQSCQCEVAEVGSDGSTEHESLGRGTFTQNLLQLVLEFTLSEQLVGLIEDDGLHPRQSEVCFGEQLHESTGSGDDDVGIDG